MSPSKSPNKSQNNITMRKMKDSEYTSTKRKEPVWIRKEKQMSPIFNQKLSHSTVFKMKIWWFQTQRLLKLKRGMTLKSWQRKRLFSRKQNKLSRKWMVCLSRNCQTQAPYKISTARGFSKIGQTNKGDKFNVTTIASFRSIRTHRRIWCKVWYKSQ